MMIMAGACAVHNYYQYLKLFRKLPLVFDGGPGHLGCFALSQSHWLIVMKQEVGVSASRFANNRNGNFVQMEISVPTGWNGKAGVPLKVVYLFWKMSI